MNRRSFLQSAAGAALVPMAAAQARRPPNIVLIMADDLGYECLQCNGATEYRTPNLDALAAQGVRFARAHSTPLCTPTRVQLMTGKYNFRNYTEFGSLPRGEFTFAHLLREAGYRTCAVGKWQLAGAIEGTAYRGVGTMPRDAGFDEYCLWQVKDRGSRFWDPTVDVNGELHKEMKGKYGPDVFTDYALQFAEKHRNRPFFLYYPMALTHDPFVPTPLSKGFSKENEQRSETRWFGDMVAHMDEVAGRIVKRIDQLGLSGDTIILFTGDNGTHPSIITQTKNGPYKGAKGSPIKAGTHVPLIARWQGASPKGAVCDDLIDFTDFLPTLAEASEARIPGNHPRDGRSFLAQVKGQKGSPRELIFCHYDPRWGGRQFARWAMDKRWKLYSDGRFFDIQNDPRELKPVAQLSSEMSQARPKFQAVLDRMKPAGA